MDARPTYAVDPKNHGKPLWCVYGISKWWPQLLLCKLLPYTQDHRPLPVGHQAPIVCIWGYSVWKGRPGFRTLGVDVEKWIVDSGIKYGPYFFDDQEHALERLRQITKPSRSAS